MGAVKIILAYWAIVLGVVLFTYVIKETPSCNAREAIAYEKGINDMACIVGVTEKCRKEL